LAFGSFGSQRPTIPRTLRQLTLPFGAFTSAGGVGVLLIGAGHRQQCSRRPPKNAMVNSAPRVHRK
jgi:hypothetical protein